MSILMTHRPWVLSRLVAGGRGARVVAVVRIPSLWVAAASAGLLLTAETTHGRADHTSGWALVSTGAVVVGLLAALIAASVAAVARSESHRRHVFRARHIFASGVGLVLVAAMLVVAMVWHGAFVHLFSDLRLGSADVADTGLVVGTVVSLTFAGAALIDARDAQHDEHDWDIGPIT